MATLTPVLGLQKPVVGADDDVWGGMLNGNMDILDGLVRPVDLGPYLLKAGGTLTGPLVLAGNAAAALNPVPLQQLNTAIGAYLPLVGGTMLGDIVLLGNATANLNPVPLQQLNSGLATKIGDAPADSAYYARRNNAWAVAPGSAITTDAPSDGSAYGRLNAAWAKVLPLAGGTMTGVIRGFNGTSAAPGYAFSGDVGTGLFYPGANSLGLSVAGAYVATFKSDTSVVFVNAQITPKGNLMLGMPEPANISTTSPANGGGVLRAWYTIANNYMSFCYYDLAGATYRRLTAVNAPFQMQASNGYQFLGAAAGAADSAFTWTSLFTVSNFGAIGVGADPPSDLLNGGISCLQIVATNAIASSNIYYSTASNGWKYRTAGYGAMWYCDPASGSALYFYTAPNGAAGATATITNRVTVHSGGINVYGDVANATNIYASNLVQGNYVTAAAGVVLARTNGNATMAMYSTSGGCNGWWNGSDNVTWWGVCDGSGNPQAGKLSIKTNGDVSAAGSVFSGNTMQAPYIHATTQMWCDQWIQANLIYGGADCYAGWNGDNSFGIYRAGRTFVCQYQANYWWGLNLDDAQCRWSGNNQIQFQFRNGTVDWLSWNPVGTVGGNGAYYNISDRRMKDEIEPSPVGLTEVLRLQPVKFRRIEHKRGSDFAPNGKPLPPMRERREVGFIAQDVQAVLPDAVVDIAGEDEEPLLAMTYDTITVALVAAVQTLNARLAALEGRRK